MMQMRYWLLLAIVSCASFHAAALLRGSPRSSLHDDQDLVPSVTSSSAKEISNEESEHTEGVHVASANPASVEEKSHQSNFNEAPEHSTGDYDNDEEVPSVSVEENAPWLSERAKKFLASAALAGAFTAGSYYKQQDAGIGGVPAEIYPRRSVFNIDGNPMKEFNLLVKNDGENTRIVNVDMTHPLPKSQPMQEIISRVDSNPMKESNLLVKNEGEIPTSNQLTGLCDLNDSLYDKTFATALWNRDDFKQESCSGKNQADCGKETFCTWVQPEDKTVGGDQ